MATPATSIPPRHEPAGPPQGRIPEARGRRDHPPPLAVGSRQLDEAILAAEQAVAARDARVRRRLHRLDAGLHQRLNDVRRYAFVLGAAGMLLAGVLAGSSRRAAAGMAGAGAAVALPLWQRLLVLLQPLAATWAARWGVPPSLAALLAQLLGPAGLARGSVRAAPADPVRPAAQVDLRRYLGRWFEVARLPVRQQARCAGDVSALYEATAGGTIRVQNRCRLRSGRVEQALGEARVQPGSAGARLRVSFVPGWLRWLPGVWAPYWILWVAGDYGAALVGTPDRRRLWLLSRRPDLDGDTYEQLVAQAAAQGYDVGRLVRTAHGAGPAPGAGTPARSPWPTSGTPT
jgi:apolipoprotein D and lipocalin family protein